MVLLRSALAIFVRGRSGSMGPSGGTGRGSSCTLCGPIGPYGALMDSDFPKLRPLSDDNVDFPILRSIVDNEHSGL